MTGMPFSQSNNSTNNFVADEPLMGMGGDASGGYVNTFPSDPVV